jgi:hypothetical protein
MVSIKLLKSTSLVIQVIEETIAELDPYNHDFPYEENFSIQNCEFPEQVEDPFALVRCLKGEEFAKQLEYEDHIVIILQHITTCFLEELGRKGINEYELDDYITSDEDDTDERPGRPEATNSLSIQYEVAS